MGFIEDYKEDKRRRCELGVPPLPLNKKQTLDVISLLKSSSLDRDFLIDLLLNRVPPGVDSASKEKAYFLASIIEDKLKIESLDKFIALRALGDMLGGYNVKILIKALNNKDDEVCKIATNLLMNIILVYDDFYKIKDMSKTNKHAKDILLSWANGEWFKNKKSVPKNIKAIVFKVNGETNTDDLSPASEAYSRSDIPLHANSMLINKMKNPIDIIKDFKKNNHKIVYVGDVVGTGSSRKSAINSIQWYFGEDLKGVPNKKTGGVVIGGIIAPIFFNTAQDSGAMPIVADVGSLKMGDIIDIDIVEGKIFREKELISRFKIEPKTLLDEYRANGRIPLIIGRNLTSMARDALNMSKGDIFIETTNKVATNSSYTLAQKIVGKACNRDGVSPGEYVEVETITVGSQDTTGPMTRDEIKELASLKFKADFVLQSFCHTAAYPRVSDVELERDLPNFMIQRGGVAIKAGDGIIHSWLNRFSIPDTLGTGADSHTRFPLGISFPAGSGLVAFSAVTGMMPLNMPQSVLVKFKGKMRRGITLRDLVNAIPYFAIKKGLLTVEKKNKKNIFSGKILEIEGLENIKIEQAFEFSDASAERSASSCVIKLNKEPIIEYLKSNIKLIESLISAGYQSIDTLKRRAKKMQEWVDNPTLLRADKDAKYEAVIEIDLSKIDEPILACPNDPDDVLSLSEVLEDKNRPHKIDEVFIGSCMNNIGHYRAVGEILKGKEEIPTRLWIVPPTKMDKRKLISEGYFYIFGKSGARMELPGCSLCMGNQARTAVGASVFSTSTRNFDNRMGKDAKVYLGSSELAAVCAILGRIPTKKEYLESVNSAIKEKNREDIYKYLNFHLLEDSELNALIG